MSKIQFEFHVKVVSGPKRSEQTLHFNLDPQYYI
jgi:hypothetical protein